MAKKKVVFDTHIDLVTPENISFHNQVAGPSRRLFAYVIDVLVRLGIIAAFYFIIGLFSLIVYQIAGTSLIPSGGVIIAASLVLYFLLDWFYGGFLETIWNGQTVGKKSLGIRVVSVSGHPISAWQAILRNILRIVDHQPMIPLAYIGMVQILDLAVPLCFLGLTFAALTKRFQRIGDLAAGTMVIVENETYLRGVVPMNDKAVKELAAQLPMSFMPTNDLMKALSEYVMRRKTLHPQTRFNMAKPLGSVLIEKFELPIDTNPDTLLCAMYLKHFTSFSPEDVELPKKPKKTKKKDKLGEFLANLPSQ